VLSFAAGVTYTRWRLALLPGVAAPVVTVVIAQFNPVQGDLLMQLGGLLLLGIAGVVGGIAYRSFTRVMKRHRDELDFEPAAQHPDATHRRRGELGVPRGKMHSAAL